MLGTKLFLATALAIAQAGQASPVADAARLLQSEAANHRLILVGEMHGTRETPQLVAALVSAYAEQGPVRLGMEIDSSLAPLIDAYLASDGGTAARALLLASPSWHVPRERNDGRRNLEAIDLIEHVRLLMAQGRDVGILPFDNPPGAYTNSQARDIAMAGRIRSVFSNLPRGRLVSLSGNVHAMLKRPTFAPPEMQDPMGSYLRDLEPFSVDIAARGGEFWACRDGRCGELLQWPVFRESGEVGEGNFHFRIVLPQFSAARLIPE